MLPFAGVINTLKKIQDDLIIEIIQQIVKDNANEIIDLNTKDQLFREGVDSDGESLGVYSNSYKWYKQNIVNQPYDRVTLKLTGDFHKSFKVIIGKKEFEIDATDWKASLLATNYGKKIFGLTDSNLDLFKELIVQPELIERIKKQILKR